MGLHPRETDGSESRHFNASRLWLNTHLHSQTGALPSVKVANEIGSPAMYADTYPANKVLCTDEVHPLDAGAADLGKGTIAHGVASFGKAVLK